MASKKPEQRKQMMEILRDPLTCNQGTRAIARFVGMSCSTVSAHRSRIKDDPPIYMKGIVDEISIAKLRLDGGTQSRSEVIVEAIEGYAEAIKRGEQFPPIGVVYDGTDYWVWDGFHRVPAHAKAKKKKILAEIRQGTCRDAVLLSAGANATNGERRTNADKRRAVETLLRDEEWSQWSEREIGRRCAVSFMLVASVKKQGQLSARELQIEPERKVERNGTTYHMNTAKIGRSQSPPTASPEPEDEEDAMEPDTFGGHPADGYARPATMEIPLDPDEAAAAIFDNFSQEDLGRLIDELARLSGHELVAHAGEDR